MHLLVLSNYCVSPVVFPFFALLSFVSLPVVSSDVVPEEGSRGIGVGHEWC